MPVVTSAYWVRVRVTGDESGVNTYHSALDLAATLAQEHPGLTFEVAEDKVWSSVRYRTDTPGGNNATQELQESGRTEAQRRRV